MDPTLNECTRYWITFKADNRGYNSLRENAPSTIAYQQTSGNYVGNNSKNEYPVKQITPIELFVTSLVTCYIISIDSLVTLNKKKNVNIVLGFLPSSTFTSRKIQLLMSIQSTKPPSRS